MARNVSLYLADAVEKNKKILVEGAQGTFLDIDFGTYPYVTASNPTVGGACTGLGLSPKRIDRVIGVAKAYTTRVGMGPFPTELLGPVGEKLRNVGNEFGATTGRPRRCGWFDAVIAKYACRVNGLDEVVITKLDVLSGLPKIKIGAAYRYRGRKITDYPFSAKVFSECKVCYEEMPGWPEDIRKVRRYRDLPKAAARYLDRLEELLEVKISLVSVGSSREQTIVRR
jgi:adenylosuccinate synthase